MGGITAAFKEFEERVSAVKDPSAVKTEMIKSAIRRKIGSFAISDIEKECPSISRVFIKQVISRLKEEGHLSLQGKGRGSKWLASEKFKYEGK